MTTTDDYNHHHMSMDTAHSVCRSCEPYYKGNTSLLFAAKDHQWAGKECGEDTGPGGTSTLGNRDIML